MTEGGSSGSGLITGTYPNDRFVVTVSGPGRAHHTEPEADAADAYARAVLYVLGSDRSAQPSVAAPQAR